MLKLKKKKKSNDWACSGFKIIFLLQGRIFQDETAVEICQWGTGKTKFKIKRLPESYR